ncbi:MAG: hypothetical protein ACTSUO_10115 [Candidatus Thorarchaeota archaeon]
MDIEKREHLEKIADVGEKIIEQGGVTGEELEKMCPTNHTFFDGMYMREIFMPAGTLVVSKIHKTNHPYFVMIGKCKVMTENGVETIEAPYVGGTAAGTQRILYVLEDTHWLTVHATEETDLEKIEEQIIAKTVSDLELTDEQIRELTEVEI